MSGLGGHVTVHGGASASHGDRAPRQHLYPSLNILPPPPAYSSETDPPSGAQPSTVNARERSAAHSPASASGISRTPVPIPASRTPAQTSAANPSQTHEPTSAPDPSTTPAPTSHSQVSHATLPAEEPIVLEPIALIQERYISVSLSDTPYLAHPRPAYRDGAGSHYSRSRAVNAARGTTPQPITNQTASSAVTSQSRTHLPAENERSRHDLPDNEEGRPLFDPPQSHFLGALLATVFCCPLIGALAIMASVRCEKASNEGKRDDAEIHSKTAASLNILAVVVGCFIAIVIGLVFLIAPLFQSPGV